MFSSFIESEGAVADSQPESPRSLPLAMLGERYRRYRLSDPEAEREMVSSLKYLGQIAPVVVVPREGVLEVLDGFKRLSAARTLGWSQLRIRAIAADDRQAKAAIYGLNCTGRRTQEWEEAWIVQALVREDGMNQVEVAELLHRHKSWVCRRLALVEKLSAAGKADLRLGLLSPTVARALTRLPVGNQDEVLVAARQAGLSAAETGDVADLFLATNGRKQQDALLADPRQALRQANRDSGWAHDPRLSMAGNRIARRLAVLLDLLGRMENWLLYRGRADLTVVDRTVLQPAFERLVRDGDSVAVQTRDYLGSPS